MARVAFFGLINVIFFASSFYQRKKTAEMFINVQCIAYIYIYIVDILFSIFRSLFARSLANSLALSVSPSFNERLKHVKWEKSGKLSCVACIYGSSYQDIFNLETLLHEWSIVYIRYNAFSLSFTQKINISA